MASYYVDGAVGNDSNAGTSPGVGNAWATLAHAAATATASGSLVYVKSSATYTLTSAVVWGSAGVTVRGYTTTPGAEDGYPTITTSTNSIILFNVAADNLTFRQLNLSSTAGTPGVGIAPVSAVHNQTSVLDCKLSGFSVGIDGSYVNYYAFTYLFVWRCEVTGCATGVASHECDIHDSWIHGNTGDGWLLGAYSVGDITINGCAFEGNGGKNLNWSADRVGSIRIVNTAIRGSTSDGIYIGSTTIAPTFYLQDCTIETSGGYGINGAVVFLNSVQKTNAFRGNSSGNRNATFVPAGEGDITLTGDPYTSASTGDYSTNTTAGAGAALRAAGFPGVARLGTGYRDVGPLQSQASGGSTTIVVGPSGYGAIMAI